MMKKRRLAVYLDLGLNAVIVLSTVLAVLSYFTGSVDALGSQQTHCFDFFTTDSNILVSLAALMLCAADIKKLTDETYRLPVWLLVFKFTGTVAVTITFLTVVFILAPFSRAPFFWFFMGPSFPMHFFTPLLSVLSLLLLERDRSLPKKALWAGFAPTAVYSVVYFIMVVVVRRWSDFYGFTFGGRYRMIPLSVGVMYLLTLAVAWAERRLHDRGVRS